MPHTVSAYHNNPNPAARHGQGSHADMAFVFPVSHMRPTSAHTHNASVGQPVRQVLTYGRTFATGCDARGYTTMLQECPLRHADVFYKGGHEDDEDTQLY